MRIGNMLISRKKGIRWKLGDFFTKIFGVFILHTPYRIGSLIKRFKKYLKNKRNQNISVLEIGCGSGNNLLELYKLQSKFKFNLKAYGYDKNKNNIIEGREIIKYNHIENISLYESDATKISIAKNNKYDFILLIDFLEHIHDDVGFIKSISYLFNYNKYILISVPTIKYKYVFGEKTHKNVGHVRDGYSIKDINNIFQEYGYTIDYFEYNSGLIGSIGLSLFHKYEIKNGLINSIKNFFIFLLFKNIDFINGPKYSCSLFLV